MLRKLWIQLSAAFLLVALLAIGVVALLVANAVETSFRGYLGREDSSRNAAALIETLQAHYAQSGSWDGVQALLPTPRGETGQHSDGGQGNNAGGGARFLVVDTARRIVAASDETRIGEAMLEGELGSGYPLYHEQTQIGWLMVDSPGRDVLDQAQMVFLNEVRTDLLWAAGLAAILALVVGIGLGLLITRPLRQLTDAAQSLAGGDLGLSVAVPAVSPAEVEALATTFNHMSQALADAEAQRQRISSDIAHELRTPVSVMRGQLQAMLDGVQPLDARHVAIVYDQTLHLARLVDDLRLLTQAESGHLPLDMKLLQPGEVIQRAASLFEALAQDAGLTLSHRIEPDLPRVLADSDRLHQVLANLLANALRHVPPGGAIRLEARRADATVHLNVANSGITLTADQAAHVFERFWRADEARDRDRGGAGLGLAIAQQIVRLHGGRIWVDTSEGETCFTVEIPAHHVT